MSWPEVRQSPYGSACSSGQPAASSVIAITMPFARARYVVGLLSWASAFSNSCLTPSASAGARPRIPARHGDCARADQSLTVFSAIAEEGDDAVGPENGLVRPCGHGAPARASASSSRMAPRLKSTPASSN